MTRNTDDAQRLLWLYSTGEHECSYLPERTARTVFVDPRHPLDSRQYALLARQGMRRSGPYVYQPNCPACRACKSLRVDARAFTPNRSQRRCLKRNTDLQVITRPPEYRDEHFRLYLYYLSRRHPGSGMDDPDPDRYMDFLVAGWANTRFHEIRLDGMLLGVAVTDRLPDGLSAVYTFFHPDYPGRSLGTWAILWQIEQARQAGLPWVYLGYWIAECAQMRYKTAFQPCEIHDGGRWRRWQRDRDDPATAFVDAPVDDCNETG